jgi:hypothetical protein
MEGLEISQGSAVLGMVKKTKSTAKPVQPAKRKRKEPEEEAPRRQSARLKKVVVDPNETPEQRRKREVCHSQSFFSFY